MSNPPIFVVGAPRSGTTLLASMLAGHSQIDCGPETQFFNKIGERKLRQAVAASTWPTEATELVASLTLAGQKVHDLFGLSRDDIAQFLTERQPSVKAMLESLTKNHASKSGKPRWAEKTPNHLLHLDTIRKEFPHSPIIRIVRDPRDSAQSMKKLPWASQSVLANCYLWNAWYQTSTSFFQSDDNTLTVKYEDLVRQPEQELLAICNFVGEKYEPAMLATERTGQAVSSQNETWKVQNAKPLNRDRLSIWKEELTPELQQAATLCCLPGIEAFGYEYEVEQEGLRTMQVYPFGRSVIEDNEEAFIDAAKQGIRLVEASSPLTAAQLFIVPSFDPSKRSRAAKLLHFLTVLSIRRIRQRPALYIATSVESVDGCATILRTQFLKVLGKSLVRELV